MKVDDHFVHWISEHFGKVMFHARIREEMLKLVEIIILWVADHIIREKDGGV